MSKQKLYLCDPRKNAACRGTVCFYGPGPWHWCCMTDDPACAVTGPQSGPLAVDTDAGVAIYDNKNQDGGWIWPPKEGREEHAAFENAAAAAGDL